MTTIKTKGQIIDKTDDWDFRQAEKKKFAEADVSTTEVKIPHPTTEVKVPVDDNQRLLDAFSLAPEELKIDPEPIKVRTKEQISSSYLEECKTKYRCYEETPKVGVVVGASSGNIGLTIAASLVSEKWDIRMFDKKNWKRSNIHSGDAALILANSTNWLDWVENFPARKAEKIIADTLTESILSSQEFVSQTINTPYRKKIVFIGSMAYRSVLNGSSVYCAAKAGLAHYARCLAWELAPKGYDVFIIHPSNTLDTPMTKATIEGLINYRNLEQKDAEAYWGANLPRESFLTKKEIAEAVLHVLSPNAGYYSGGQIELAGGQR